MSNLSNLGNKIFAEAVNLDPELREAYLNDICEDNEELRKYVNDLFSQMKSFDEDEYEVTLEADAKQKKASSISEDASSHTAKNDDLKESSTGTIVTNKIRPRIASSTNDPDVWSTAFEVQEELPEIPGYEVYHQIGHGAMGVVFRARQIQANREVAVKMIRAEGYVGAAKRRRFQTEAEAIARLQHPNIVQIFEVGECQSMPFFSLEFCSWGTLDDFLDGNLLSSDDSATLLRDLAQAIETAHASHVIHRDLKPANILLAARPGVEIPEEAILEGKAALAPLNCFVAKLTDFGLAKKMDDVSTTRTGMVMGTPAYMAPEQAQGDSEVGPLADVYSLGAILYECLTGRPPFLATSNVEMILQVTTKEPIPPRSLQPNVPRDLETICLKCLAKTPEKRYLSAGELAEDLQRFLDNQPIKARPLGALGKCWRWTQRNPLTACLTFALILALIAGTAVSSVMAVRANDKAKDATEARRQTEKSLDKAKKATSLAKKRLASETKALLATEQARKEAADNAEKARYQQELSELQLYGNQLRLAQKYWQENNVIVARQTLNNTPKRFRGWEYHYLRNQLFDQGQLTRPLPIPTFLTSSIDVSPQGNSIVMGLQDKLFDRGIAVVLDLKTGKELHRFRRHRASVNCVAYSPDGKRIASGDNDNLVRIWNARTGKELSVLRGLKQSVTSLAFSPNGKLLVTGGGNRADRFAPGELAIWDTTTGRQLFSLPGANQWIRDLAFSADGSRVVIATGAPLILKGKSKPDNKQPGFQLNITNMSEKQKQQLDKLFKNPTRNGSRFPTFSNQGEIKVIDLINRRPLLTLTQPVRNKRRERKCTKVAYSQDGKYIAGIQSGTSFDSFFGDSGHAVHLWDSSTGELLHTLDHQQNEIHDLQFNPTSQQLTSASEDGTLKVWDVESGRLLQTLRGHTKPVGCIAYSADANWIVSTSKDGTWKLWDAVHGPAQREVIRELPSSRRIAVSPDCQDILFANEKQLRRIQLSRGGQQKTWLRLSQIIDCVTFGPKGDKIAIGDSSGKITLWDMNTKKKIMTLDGGKKYLRYVAFSPDGQRIVSAPRKNELTVWDVTTGKALFTQKAIQSSLCGIAFSPDSQNVITAEGIVLDRTGQKLLNEFNQFLEPFAPLNPLKPKGLGKIKVWNAQNGKLYHEFKDDKGDLMCMAVSPDGKWIVSGIGGKLLGDESDWGEVIIREASTAKIIHTFPRRPHKVTALAFSKQGRLFSGYGDGTITVHDPVRGLDVFTIQAHKNAIVKINISVDGSQLLTIDEEGSIKLWDSPKQSIQAEKQFSNRNVWNSRWHLDQLARAKNQRDWFQVAFHLQHLTNKEPWNARYHSRRAFALQQLGKTPEAVAEYLRAILIDPKVPLWPNVSQTRKLGDEAAMQENYSKAAEEFKIAIWRPQADFNDWRSLMLSQLASGQISQYQQSADELFTRYAENTSLGGKRIILNLCTFGPVSPSLAQRLIDFAESLTKQKNTDPYYHFLLGKAYYRVGQYQKALDQFDHCKKVMKNNGFIDITYFAALSLYHLNERDLPEKMFQRINRWYTRTLSQWPSEKLKNQWPTWHNKVKWQLWMEDGKRLLEAPIPMPKATS